MGIDQINHTVALGPEDLQALLEAFMRYEVTLIGQVDDHVASAIADRLYSDIGSRALDSTAHL